MPVLAEIDAAELEGLALAVEADQKTMLACARVAANRAIRWARTQVARGLASRLGVPSGVIAKRLKERRAEGKNTRASVWIGLDPINVERAGPSETPSGLRAGGQDFRGAFVAKGRYGGRVAMRRKGAARVPLEGVSFDVASLAPATLTRGTWPGLNQRFLAFYREELERRTSGH